MFFQKAKFKRVEPPLSTPKLTQQEIKNKLFDFFNHHDQLYPIFIEGLTTVEDAVTNSDILPLVYIWNEQSTSNGVEFEVSVNGAIVGKALESFLPCNSPDFNPTRDSFMLDIAGIVQKSSIATCNKLGAPPSVVFASHYGDD